jgi:hypothetical protein
LLIPVVTTQSRSRGKRSDEQAAYFALTRADAIKLGEEAKAFTAAAPRRPFTIQARWRRVFGPARYYACVFTADGNDLSQNFSLETVWRVSAQRARHFQTGETREHTSPLQGAWSSRLNRLDSVDGDSETY